MVLWYYLGIELDLFLKHVKNQYTTITITMEVKTDNQLIDTQIKEQEKPFLNLLKTITQITVFQRKQDQQATGH